MTNPLNVVQDLQQWLTQERQKAQEYSASSNNADPVARETVEVLAKVEEKLKQLLTDLR